MKSTNLKFTKTFETKKEKLVVKIQLNDECKNGHADFTITASGYIKGKLGQWANSFAGCCHDEILKVAPELKIFVDLHLSDINGAPMHAVENGFYHLWNEEKNKVESTKITKKYLRITDKELKVLSKVQDKNWFNFQLEELGIVKRWKQEALKAIEVLENLIDKEGGVKWDHDFKWKRSQYVTLNDGEVLTLKEKIKDGYFRSENEKKRKLQKSRQRISKKINDRLQEQKAIIKKENIDCALDIWLIKKLDRLSKAQSKNSSFYIDGENIIYYNHSNEFAFNWRGYGKGTTKESFDIFIDSIKKSDYKNGLPKNVKFILKT